MMSEKNKLLNVAINAISQMAYKTRSDLGLLSGVLKQSLKWIAHHKSTHSAKLMC